MLQPDYFADKADRMIALYSQLENWILKDIARRMVASEDLPATADRLIWKLEQMGEHKAVILKKLSKLTGVAEKELKRLLQNAVLTSWKDDSATWDELGITLSNPLDNAAVIAVMDAEYQKSLGELRNLTNTTLTDSSTALGRMLDAAEMRVASGVQSYDAAIAEILDKYAAGGAYVTYPTGRRMSLESAVRMIVVTSMNQTAGQISNQYVKEAGTNYVLVSAHYGARIRKKGQPELAGHDLWQGKTYSIRGSEPGYPNLLEATGYDIDPVTGTGRVVNPLGLHGYNCRHSHKPWDKRLRNPWRDKDGNLIDGSGNRITAEENKRIYELQQKQRGMERGIRQTKRMLIAKNAEVEGTMDPETKESLEKELDSLSSRLIRQNKAYNDFCEKNKLKPDYARTKIASAN